MLQAAPFQPSEWDKGLEQDFEGAEETIDFNTSRLKLFPEDYQMLMQIENPNERIITKQLLFMRHEKEIKKNIKHRKKFVMKNTTPRCVGQDEVTRDNDVTLKEPSQEQPSNHTMNTMTEQIKDVIGIEMDAPLSSLGSNAFIG